MEGKENSYTENPYKERNDKLNQQFDDLYIDQKIQLPLSMINPIISDDFKYSYTEGPIEVFRGGREGKILIHDGNHRYFKIVRDLFLENLEENDNLENINLDEIFIEVKKVYPAGNEWLLKK